MKVGDAVVFVDPRGNEHPAILTAVWGPPESNPSVNLVFVSKDETKHDTYGRQIERETSVVHESNQYAHGMYWKTA